MGVREPMVLDEDTKNGVEELDVEISDSESEEEEEDVKLTEPSKTAAYNKDGLLDKLGDIIWPKNVDWIQKLSIDINQDEEIDVNDDSTREIAFYTQALEGAREAFLKFQSSGRPFLRPADYYAEMVKSDVHMEKVKSRVLAEKRQIEEAEERRKARENKKMAKQVQAEKQKERAKQKKEGIESVKKWRKQRQRSGFAEGEKEIDFGPGFEDGKGFERSSKRRPGVGPGDRSGGKGRPGGGKGMGKGKKSFDKNSKFGFGGRKGMKKQNTAETTNDLRGFNKGDFSGKNKRKR